jgi:hypothetical protein
MGILRFKSPLIPTFHKAFKDVGIVPISILIDLLRIGTSQPSPSGGEGEDQENRERAYEPRFGS